MKNKVMGKALSWVLSAAMALTMSGAIPAMTTSVYADSTATPNGTYFATVYGTSASTVDKLYFGYMQAAGTGTKTALAWNVNGNKSTGSDKTSGVVPISYNYAASTYSTTWKSAIETALKTTQYDLNSLLKTTTINFDGDNSYSNLTVGDDTAASTVDQGVNAKLYLPNAHEIINNTALTSTYWTRDTLTTKATGYDTVTAAGNTVASGKPVGVKSTDSTVSAIYSVNGNLDLASDTTKSKVLFANVASTGSVTLTLVDNSYTQPDVKSADITSGTKAVVKLNTAVPDGYSVGWFATSANTAYSEKNAALAASGLLVSSEITDSNKTITITNNKITDQTELYLYYYKTADDTVTKVASTPLDLTSFGKVAPTTANFTIDDFTYSGHAYATETEAVAAVTAASLITVKADTGYTLNGAAPTVTITAIQKDGKEVAPTSTAKLIFKAGETYTLIGTVPAFSEKKTSDSSVKQFATSTKVTLGTMTIAKKALTASNITFSLPAVDQYAAASSLTYTLASLKLTDATDIAADDTVNATNVTCTFKDAAATDVVKASATSNIVIKAAFSTLDNANYSISGTNFVLSSASDTSLQVKVTAQPAKSVKIKLNPTKMNYVEGAAFDPTGMVATVTYSTGTTKDYLYSSTGSETNGYWTITPAATTTVLSASNPTTFTVKWAPSENDAAMTAGTLTPTVNASAIALTNISIPKTLTVNVGASIDIPVVTYYPSDYNGSRTVTWSCKTEDNNTALAVDFTQYNTTTKVTEADITTNGSTATLAKIEGLAAGTVKLYATVGTAVASTTITIKAINNSIKYSRISGDGRYDTAAAIAKAAYPSGVSSGTAVLVSGTNFPDALSASGLAGTLDAPVLLTDPKTLSTQTAELIKTWNLSTIYVVGGNAAVSSSIDTTLKSDCNVTTVKRVFGDDRYETAAAVYNTGRVWGSACFVTTGSSAADALSISPWAYVNKYPIFLAKDDGTLSGATLSLVEKFSTVYIIGGTKAVSSTLDSTLKTDGVATVKRLYGDDRYQTSAKIAEFFAGPSVSGSTTTPSTTGTYNNAIFASGADAHYVDALVGGMLAGGSVFKTVDEVASPIILVDGTSGAGFDLVADSFTVNATTHHNVNKVYFLGGASAVPATTANAVLNNWNDSKEDTAVAPLA